MRIVTRLKIISAATIAALIVLAPVLFWSFLEFRSANNDDSLVDAINVGFSERTSFSGQYFLYREDRLRAQWDKGNKAVDHLLRQAEIQFHDEENLQALERLRRHIEDSANIFQRIVNNQDVLKTATGNRQVYEELDKRLFSQLLLKNIAIRDMTTALKDASTQHIERAYQHLTVIIGLFAATLTLATILVLTHLVRLIRRRLAPLHDGAKIVAGGNLDYRIQYGGSDEFAELALSINAMTDKLQVFTRQLEADLIESKHTKAALQASEERWKFALEGSGDGVWDWNLQTDEATVSKRFDEILGFAEGEFWNSGDAWKNSIHPQDKPRVMAEFQAYLTGKAATYANEHRLLCKDGNYKWTLARGMVTSRDADGRPLRMTGTLTDISKRKQVEDALRESEARLRALLDNVPYLIWLKDMDGRFIAVNKAFFNTTGRAGMDEVLGRTDLDLWPEELARKYRADDAEVVSTRKQKLTEEISMDNGEVHWVETFKAPIMDKDGNLLGTTGFAQDITGRKIAEGKIQHLAHYDPLTDLPNRTLFSDRLQQALATAKRDKTHMALMFLDLDKFKPVNDALGHHVGDLLLKEAAQRMQDCVRESDTVARIGGDEFVVLLPAVETAQDALLVAEKIRQALNQPFVLVGQSLNISSSTGIAVYPEHGKNEAQLVKNADLAMYHAKEGGRDNVKLYQPEMAER